MLKMMIYFSYSPSIGWEYKGRVQAGQGMWSIVYNKVSALYTQVLHPFVNCEKTFQHLDRDVLDVNVLINFAES